MSGRTTDSGVDAAWTRRLRRNLTRWYDAHARDLPWRRTRDAYAVWISEIMLQQTTVVAVIPYYERFLARFPTVTDLARGQEEEVLRLWEGLGYYSRARNIHRTARQVVQQHDGRFPADVETLLTLPGIGRYTAGAIASFAYDRRAPIVEANTLRLYCRLLGFRGDPRASAGQRLLWEFAEEILPPRGAGRFNQALMELGGTVCTPTSPACEDCPVKGCCRAFAESAQAEIPRAQARPQITAVTEGTVALAHQGSYLLYRRPPGERWAGLWDFPRFPLQSTCPVPKPKRRQEDRAGTPVPGQTFAHARAELEQLVNGRFGVVARLGALVTEIQHSVTRYRIRLLCFHATCEARRGIPENVEAAWVRPERFADYPLSMTGRKFAKLLQKPRH